MPDIIEKLLNIFTKKKVRNTITISKIKGAFIGSGIGESLG
jgi:hypothetical protein